MIAAIILLVIASIAVLALLAGLAVSRYRERKARYRGQHRTGRGKRAGLSDMPGFVPGSGARGYWYIARPARFTSYVHALYTGR